VWQGIIAVNAAPTPENRIVHLIPHLSTLTSDKKSSSPGEEEELLFIVWIRYSDTV
jgi:hypothetical protein